MDIKVKLNGVDITAKVDRLGEHGGPPLGIHQSITHRISTCELSLVAPTAAPATWQTLVISNTGETENYFAGYVTAFRSKVTGISLVYALRGQDYSVLLDSVIANKVYTSSTGKAVVQNLLSSYLSEITTADFVDDDLTTIDRIVFNRVTLRQALEEVSQAVGWDWFVDGDKKLHWFAPTATQMAPLGLSDTSDDNAIDFPFQMIDYGKDAIQPINDILVEGARQLSGDTTWELGSDGVTLYVGLPYRLLPPDGETEIDVWTNSGNDGAPVWDVNTVGIDGQDTGKDVYYNRKDRLLRFEVAPLDLNLSVKVTGQFELMIASRQYDYGSYATYGRWFKAVYTDDRIDSETQATLKGKALIRQHSADQEYGTLLQWEDGLTVGDMLWIKDLKRGLGPLGRGGFFLVRKIDWRWIGATLVEYTVGFASINPSSYELSFNDFLVYLDRASQKHSAVVDQEEVPYEYIRHVEELSLLCPAYLHTTEGEMVGQGVYPDDYMYTGTSRNLGRDQNNVIWAVYGSRIGGAAPQIKLMSRATTGVWTEVATASEAGRGSSLASCAVDSNGDIHIVWYGAEGGTVDLYYRMWDASAGAWAATALAIAEDTSVMRPEICINGSDEPCVVWLQGDDPDIIRYRHRTGATWDAAETVASDGTYDMGQPHMALDADDDVHVVWPGKGSGANPSVANIYYRERVAAGWQAQELITDGADLQAEAKVALDSGYNPHVTWYGYGWGVNTTKAQICYDTRNGAWAGGVALTDEAAHQNLPTISIDGSDVVSILWQLQAPYDIKYIDNDGGWGAVASLQPNYSGGQYSVNCLWATFPVVNGFSTNIPRVGVAYLWQDYYDINDAEDVRFGTYKLGWWYQ